MFTAFSNLFLASQAAGLLIFDVLRPAASPHGVGAHGRTVPLPGNAATCVSKHAPQRIHRPAPSRASTGVAVLNVELDPAPSAPAAAAVPLPARKKGAPDAATLRAALKDPCGCPHETGWLVYRPLHCPFCQNLYVHLCATMHTTSHDAHDARWALVERAPRPCPY